MLDINGTHVQRGHRCSHDHVSQRSSLTDLPSPDPPLRRLSPPIPLAPRKHGCSCADAQLHNTHLSWAIGGICTIRYWIPSVCTVRLTLTRPSFFNV